MTLEQVKCLVNLLEQYKEVYPVKNIDWEYINQEFNKTYPNIKKSCLQLRDTYQRYVKPLDEIKSRHLSRKNFW